MQPTCGPGELREQNNTGCILHSSQYSLIPSWYSLLTDHCSIRNKWFSVPHLYVQFPGYCSIYFFSRDCFCYYLIFSVLSPGAKAAAERVAGCGVPSAGIGARAASSHFHLMFAALFFACRFCFIHFTSRCIASGNIPQNGSP